MEEEKTVSFKTSEKMVYGVLNYDGNEMMATITGYDLAISFNMRLITHWRTRKTVQMQWQMCFMKH